MCKKKTTEQFIQEAREVHGDRYDYSKTEYEGSKEKVEIICKVHGSFKQIAKDHLNGSGCKHCTKGINRMTQEEFVMKANNKHNNFYDYSKSIYTRTADSIKIICPIHGEFTQIANNHLKGSGCTKCRDKKTVERQTENTDDFIKKAKLKHNDFYNYNKTEYIKSSEKVIITCPIHGDFEQKANTHINGSGCPECGKESHWRRSDYIKKANGRLCTFYTLRCFNEAEEFYKIGITIRTVKERYGCTQKMPYLYEIVSEIHGEAGLIWDLEKDEKRKLKDFNYQPDLKFLGSKTECFTQYKIDETE